MENPENKNITTPYSRENEIDAMASRAAVQGYFSQFGAEVRGSGFKLEINPLNETEQPSDFGLSFRLDETENPKEWGLQPGQYALDLELSGPQLSVKTGDSLAPTSGRFGLRLAKEIHDAEIAKTLGKDVN